MSLEGLRAWIGEVERKLAMRTRVFLVLAVIAIGGAGAAIYLAIDARESSVSESDVQALQEELETQIGAAGGGGSGTQLEAELRALQQEVTELKGELELKGETAGSAKGGGASSKGKSGSGGGGAPDSATGGAPSATELQELSERAERENGGAGQNGK